MASDQADDKVEEGRVEEGRVEERRARRDRKQIQAYQPEVTEKVALVIKKVGSSNFSSLQSTAQATAVSWELD